MSDFVEKVKEFNTVAGTLEEYNPRKVALYLGLQLEELAEQLTSLKAYELGKLITALEYHGHMFKEGAFDIQVGNANTIEQRKEFLDGAIDSAVVALGAAIAIGADVQGSAHAVADNNLSKYPVIDGVRTVLKDANGKVKKPEGFKPVELDKFLK